MRSGDKKENEEEEDSAYDSVRWILYSKNLKKSSMIHLFP